MITDSQTNKLYLADCLPERFPKFYNEFQKLLNECSIPTELIKNTKDIWAVDYMPVQIKENKFIQFRYEPDYLREYPETKTKPGDIKNYPKGNIIPSDIILDGGNIVRTKEKIIMCDKVFHENWQFTEKELIWRLKEQLEIKQLIFIPRDMDDFTGHADGMVRFIDDKTVLINDYGNEDDEYLTSFRMSLHNAGLDYIELPFFQPDDPTYTSARGLYLNYLEMEQAVFMPVFKLKSDDKAYKVLSNIFKGKKVVTVNSNEIAKEGGVLNCISWNIFAE